jgi:hypothetical protein
VYNDVAKIYQNKPPFFKINNLLKCQRWKYRYNFIASYFLQSLRILFLILYLSYFRNDFQKVVLYLSFIVKKVIRIILLKKVQEYLELDIEEDNKLSK